MAPQPAAWLIWTVVCDVIVIKINDEADIYIEMTFMSSLDGPWVRDVVEFEAQCLERRVDCQHRNESSCSPLSKKDKM